jgi:cutinase
VDPDIIKGTVVGGPLCAAMKTAANGGVACQGIGGAYKAQLAPNTQPKGTNDASINEAVKVIKQAMTACPDSKMVLAGYRYVILIAIQSCFS